MAKLSKKWKIAISIICSVVALITVALIVYYCAPWNKAFFASARKEFGIPGLDTKFTPQGFTVVDGRDDYIISGYMTDGKATRFYYITDGTASKYFTLTYQGEDYKGHAGGVTSSGDYLWVVGDKLCYSFRLSDVDSAQNGGKVETLARFDANNGADYVFVNNGDLWIGEFYKKGKYDTPKSHHLKTSSGETNHSLVFAYTIDYSTPEGIENNTPTQALSVRGECQGISMTQDGKFIMSCSYSIVDSRLHCYSALSSADSSYDYNGTSIDLWYLDNSKLITTANAPSMSEELVVKGDRVYILFESAGKKYKIFNRVQLSNVYSLPLTYFEK